MKNTPQPNITTKNKTHSKAKPKIILTQPLSREDNTTTLNSFQSYHNLIPKLPFRNKLTQPLSREDNITTFRLTVKTMIFIYYIITKKQSPKQILKIKQTLKQKKLKIKKTKNKHNFNQKSTHLFFSYKKNRLYEQRNQVSSQQQIQKRTSTYRFRH